MEPAQTEPQWTIAKVLSFAAADFGKRGLEAPRLEAELLLGHELQMSRMQLLLDANRPLKKDELARFRALIERRRSGEPSAYILGKKEFYGREFRVDRRVLIPRPETETLVDVALARTRPRSLAGRALDVGTGSGAIAVTFARERPTWQVTALDKSEDALAVARDNALRLGAVWGFRLLQSDLFSALKPTERFELIVSNPPYISREELTTLDKGILDFEPRMALDGGEDGLDFYRALVKGAPPHLTQGGVLAVEIGADQGPAVEELFKSAGFVDVELTRDYGRRDRVVSGKKPALKT